APQIAAEVQVGADLHAARLCGFQRIHEHCLHFSVERRGDAAEVEPVIAFERRVKSVIGPGGLFKAGIFAVVYDRGAADIESLFKEICPHALTLQVDMPRFDVIAFEHGYSPPAEAVVRKGSDHRDVHAGSGKAHCDVHFAAADVDVEMAGSLESIGGFGAEPHHDLPESDEAHHSSPFTCVS